MAESPASDASLDIRLPRRGRGVVALLICVAIVGAASIAAGIGTRSPLVVVWIIAYSAAGWDLVVSLRLRVVARGNELFVRNWFGATSLRRADIRAFRIQTPSLGEALKQNVAGPTVVAVVREGSPVWLAATAPRWRPDLVPRHEAALQAWLDGGNELPATSPLQLPPPAGSRQQARTAALHGTLLCISIFLIAYGTSSVATGDASIAGCVFLFVGTGALVRAAVLIIRDVRAVLRGTDA
jgi:hypothetical protein